MAAVCECGDHAFRVVSKNHVVLASPEDKDVLSLGWTVGKLGYAMRRKGYLHRAIFGDEINGLVVDHKNGNKLDNRRNNLRACTHQQNICNQKLRADSTSGFKGVSWDKKRQKWRAYIRLHGKHKSVGRYADKLEAAAAYNREAKRVYGEFARLNELADF